MLDNITSILNIIIIIILIIIFNKLVKDNLIRKKEHFLGALSGIGKVFTSLVDFFNNFPVLIGIFVDAVISFCVNFVDIVMSLYSAVEWVIEIPGWAVQGFLFLVALLADIVVIFILWLHPVNLIKGVIKLILTVIKIILSFVFDTIVHLLRLVISYIGNTVKGGLWGIPHGPDQHIGHRWGSNLPIDDDDLGYGEHHHKDHNEKHLYKPLRCYKEIGTNGFMNIIGTIICPPLGIFMSFGLAGWFKILICSGLTLLYYFPGLLYAFLITAPLGIGNDIEFEDCGGQLGGLIVKGCDERLTKEHCESTYLPNKLDKNGDKVKACKWNNNLKRCRDLVFDNSSYESLILETNPEDPSRSNYDLSNGTISDGTYAYRDEDKSAFKSDTTLNWISSVRDNEQVDEQAKLMEEKAAQRKAEARENSVKSSF